jgi:hypothetical protein
MTTIEENIKKDEEEPEYDISTISYENCVINPQSIHAFDISTRQDNDKNNKTREGVVGAFINNKIPAGYFDLMPIWCNLRQSIFNFIDQLSGAPYESAACIHKAGRKHNYDFGLKLLYKDGVSKSFKVELKFNASSISKAPQFVSPMKPSQYLIHVNGLSYEDHYYDNYLSPLLSTVGLPIPDKSAYLTQIHSTSPACMKEAQELYYKGCKPSSKFTKNPEDIAFYTLANQLSRESIQSFIQDTELDSTLLSKYLMESQQDKVYMLYHNKTFILQHNNMDDYVIDTVTKNAPKYRYECTSKNGKKMNVLLRWKNGNGIAFPAFQIS